MEVGEFLDFEFFQNVLNLHDHALDLLQTAVLYLIKLQLDIISFLCNDLNRVFQFVHQSRQFLRIRKQLIMVPSQMHPCLNAIEHIFKLLSHQLRHILLLSI